jgi:hypothetical protein
MNCATVCRAVELLIDARAIKCTNRGRSTTSKDNRWGPITHGLARFLLQQVFSFLYVKYYGRNSFRTQMIEWFTLNPRMLMPAEKSTKPV